MVIVFFSSSRIQTQHFGVKVSIVEYSFFNSGVVNSDYHVETSQDFGTGWLLILGTPIEKNTFLNVSTKRAVWRLRGVSLMSIHTWRESAKRMKPGCFPWCPVTGQDRTNWNTGGSIWTSENRFSVWWQSTGRGCGERLCSLLLADYKSHLDIVLGNLF